METLFLALLGIGIFLSAIFWSMPSILSNDNMWECEDEERIPWIYLIAFFIAFIFDVLLVIAMILYILKSSLLFDLLPEGLYIAITGFIARVFTLAFNHGYRLR